MAVESGFAAGDSAGQGEDTARPVRARLLWPLLSVVSLLILSFLGQLGYRQDAAIQEETRQVSRELRYDLNYQMRLETRMMAGIGESLAARSEIVQALAARDSTQLYELTKALFKRYKADYRITHLYFHDPDRRNLLRAHSPLIRGDLIERHTLKAAERSGEMSSGLEDGPLGPFTLRVVLPVHRQGVLVGYIELGEEIEDILRGIHAHLGVEAVLLRPKSQLSQEKWEGAMRVFGHQPEWGRFNTHALVFSSLAPLPVSMDVLIRRMLETPLEEVREWSLGEQTWQASFHSLAAADGNAESLLLVLRDVSTQVRDYRRTVFMLAGLTLLLLVGIYFVIGTLLRRTDRSLFAQQQALRDVRGRLQAVLDNVPLGIWLLDRNGRCQFANTTYRNDLKLGEGELPWPRLPRALGGLAEESSLEDAVAKLGPLPAEMSLFFADGHEHVVRVRKIPVRDAGGQLTGLLGIYDDVTDRKASAEKIRLYANLFEHGGEAMLITDHANRIIDLNPAFTRLTGYTLDEVRGENPRLLAAERTPVSIYPEMWKSLLETGFWQGELWDRRKDGHIYPKWVTISLIRDANGEIAFYTASFTDISERKAAEEKIERLAHRDALTGLFNRYSLESRLGQSLLAARRDERYLAVLFLDLDRFKLVNDTMGHAVGDRLLIDVAQRLRTCVRESDILARLGGDEFVVVLTGMDGEADAMPVAAKILEALGRDYLIDGRQLHCGPSIGVSIFPGDGDTPELLMKHADVAMYHAKEQGRNNVQFFKQELNQRATERMQLGQDLRYAIQRHELVLHYQPQIAAASGAPTGVEALVRWLHPTRGLLYPRAFIEIAEEIGLIGEIGNWVMEEACRQLAEWRARGIPGLRMAINVSAQQLRFPGLAEQAAAVLQRYRLEPGDLEMEITESTAMADPEHAIAQLYALRDCGVELAIDDFGTGYSSLAYLKHLPIQALKLDRSFVSDIDIDANDTAICVATLALARTLGLRVVAEGVETARQRDFLLREGCDYLQGNFFSRPLPPELVGAWLEKKLL